MIFPWLYAAINPIQVNTQLEEKPVNQFLLQINCIVLIHREHWLEMGKSYLDLNHSKIFLSQKSNSNKIEKTENYKVSLNFWVSPFPLLFMKILLSKHICQKLLDHTKHCPHSSLGAYCRYLQKYQA